jgi:hypothetical protein
MAGYQKSMEEYKMEMKTCPKLSTILMVEEFLQNHQETPMKMAEMKRQLPKQVMHQTLKVILEYLWRSGKIEYSPNGICWKFSQPENLGAK